MTVGIHIIADVYGVDKKLLSDGTKLMEVTEAAVAKVGLTKLASAVEQFKPQGCSGFILLAESHISFHTWPEYNLLTLDVYSCGSEQRARKVYKYIIEHVDHNHVEEYAHRRGVKVRQP